MKTFMKLIIEKFKVGADKTRVAVIAYSTKASTVFRFNTLQGSRITAENYGSLLDKMRWQRGFTYIDKALKLADNDMYTTQSGMREDIGKVCSTTNQYLVL